MRASERSRRVGRRPQLCGADRPRREIAMPSFAATYKALFASEPPPLSNDKLKRYWDLPVSQLCELSDTERWHPTAASNERHRLYAELLMAIVHHYWNGWKRGRPDDPALR